MARCFPSCFCYRLCKVTQRIGVLPNWEETKKNNTKIVFKLEVKQFAQRNGQYFEVEQD